MPLLFKAVVVLILFGVFFKGGIVAGCQVLAFIVIINVLFNKKWHAADRKRYEMQDKIASKMPVWLRRLIFIIVVVGTVGHLAFRLNQYCQEEESRCQNIPKEKLANMFKE